MGLFSRTPEQVAAAKKYAAAMDELERVSKRDRKQPDDDAWNKANDAAVAAMEDPDLTRRDRWFG